MDAYGIIDPSTSIMENTFEALAEGL